MDDFSASLILSLQIADIDAILRGSKGKNPEGRPLDAEIAMAAYREELSKNQTIIEDRRMGRSISEAVGRDGAIISTTREEEQVAIRDHELACRLGGIERPKLLMPKDLRETDVDDDFVNYLATLNVSAMEPYDEHESTGEGSSSTASFRTVSESGSTKQCVACLEYTPKHDTMLSLHRIGSLANWAYVWIADKPHARPARLLRTREIAQTTLHCSPYLILPRQMDGSAVMTAGDWWN
ncbi:hypothetical protein MMC16_001232 [Acarospora aff. strigata]|nr:hypothetical protein [Acarospora aff. strigata]